MRNNKEASDNLPSIGNLSGWANSVLADGRPSQPRRVRTLAPNTFGDLIWRILIRRFYFARRRKNSIGRRRCESGSNENLGLAAGVADFTREISKLKGKKRGRRTILRILSDYCRRLRERQSKRELREAQFFFCQFFIRKSADNLRTTRNPEALHRIHYFLYDNFIRGKNCNSITWYFCLSWAVQGRANDFLFVGHCSRLATQVGSRPPKQFPDFGQNSETQNVQIV